MITAIVTFSCALLIGVSEFFGTKAEPGTPRWARWIKLSCAAIIGGIGLYGALEGFFARGEGLVQYRNHNYIEAAESLKKAYEGPFRNEEVASALSGCYTRIADCSTNPKVADLYYKRALDICVETAARYPRSLFAPHNLIILYRHMRAWKELDDHVSTFVTQFENNYFLVDGRPLSDARKATCYATLGNVYADDNCDKYSLSKAIEYFRKALALDKQSWNALVNLPHSLISQVESESDPQNVKALLQESFDLASTGVGAPHPDAQLLAYLALARALIHPRSGEIVKKGIGLEDVLIKVQRLINQGDQIEAGVWLTLAEVQMSLRNHEKAESYLTQAEILRAKYSKRELKLAEQIKVELQPKHN